MLRVVVTFAAAAVAVGTAGADIYEFTFTGTVNQIGGIAPPGQWEGAAIGQPVSVVYTFDSEAPDQNGSSTSGRWFGPSFVLTIGAESRTRDNVRIAKQIFSSVHTYYGSSEWAESDGTLWRATVGLVDNTAMAWDGQDDSLPLDLNLDDFPEQSIHLQQAVELRGDIPEYLDVYATVDDFSWRIVPAPGTAFGLLPILLIGARRRR